MPAILRSRKPYTCRFEIAGKPCAAYLHDEDGNYCPAHQEAVDAFGRVATQGTGRSWFKLTPSEPPVEPKPHWPFWP